MGQISNPNLPSSKTPNQPGGSSTASNTSETAAIAAALPKRRFLRRIGWGLSLTVTSLVSATLGLVTVLLLPLPASLFPNDRGPESIDEILKYGFQYRVARPVNVLIMGIDRVPSAELGSSTMFEGRTDTMILLRVNPTKDSVSVLSIPRDTKVDLPTSGITTKINDANVRGGSQLAAKTVSSILKGVPVDRYVRISTDAFRELVDLLGGVYIYVPTKMSYTDNTQKLKINLEPGWQTLNGDQAEQFARFRQDGLGDIGRVQRQQVLLKALRERMTNPMVVPRLPALIASMQKYVDTNLTLEEMLALVSAGGRRISQGDFKLVLLPGRFSQPSEYVASYWIMDEVGRDRVLKQYFDLDSTETEANLAPKLQNLKIAVQNASSQPNAAGQLRAQLQKLGFANVFVTSDWSDQQNGTEIIVQQGDLDSAKQLQETLGFGSIEPTSVGDLESDLTIRIGDDWAKRGESSKE